MQAGAVVKAEGKANDLLDRIRKDDSFKAVHDKLDDLMDASKFVGRAPQQVDEFVAEVVDPILESNKELLVIENQDSVNV